MKIILSFFGDWNSEQLNLFTQNNIQVNKAHGLIEIQESDANTALINLIRSWKIGFENCRTEYNKSDINKTTVFRLNGFNEIGYPQPEDSFEYIKSTYDTHQYCDVCGIGKIQNHSIRICKEPNIIKKIFEPNWIADEFFVRKDIYQDVFFKYGIDKWDVLIHKTGKKSENYFQLKIPIIEAEFVKYDFPIEKCKKCNRVKYIENVKGFFPALKLANLKYHLFKTKDIFGVGGGAYNSIFISKFLYNELLVQNIKPSVIPVDNDYNPVISTLSGSK